MTNPLPKTKDVTAAYNFGKHPTKHECRRCRANIQLAQIIGF